MSQDFIVPHHPNRALCSHTAALPEFLKVEWQAEASGLDSGDRHKLWIRWACCAAIFSSCSVTCTHALSTCVLSSFTPFPLLISPHHLASPCWRPLPVQGVLSSHCCQVFSHRRSSDFYIFSHSLYLTIQSTLRWVLLWTCIVLNETELNLSPRNNSYLHNTGDFCVALCVSGTSSRDIHQD